MVLKTYKNTWSPLNFHHMRREVETPGNKPENPCVGACTKFRKNLRRVK